MYNKNLNKMNKETLRMQMLAGIITESQYAAKLNENEGMKVTFLKQDEAEALPDEPTNEYEEDVMDAYLFDTDQMLFDRTYSSLEDLAQTIVDENGGNVANWVSILNRMIKKGIISIG